MQVTPKRRGITVSVGYRRIARCYSGRSKKISYLSRYVACIVICIYISSVNKSVVLTYELAEVVVNVTDFRTRTVYYLGYIAVLVIGISVSQRRSAYRGLIYSGDLLAGR